MGISLWFSEVIIMDNHITTVDLEPLLVDKDTGALLSGGYINFWRDADRSVPKLVFQKVETGTDPVTGLPVYGFVDLPNPVQLSSIGTIQNAAGDNVALYYKPFDADGEVDLYYIEVFNSLSVSQFTREGWPNTFATDNPGVNGAGGSDNQISNPQFSKVSFDSANGVTIASSIAATVTVEIAPKWSIAVVFSAAGTTAVARVAVAGNSNLPTNPPFYLQVSPGVNVSGITLTQRLDNNPGIWSSTVAGEEGFVATNMMIGNNNGTITVDYTPSVGTVTRIFSQTNATVDFAEFTETVQLDPSDNTDTGDAGYVDIVITVPNTTVSRFSSVQVLPINENIVNVVYEQESVNRQVDHLFNFYKAGLDAKPIPSYLIGWDFPLNPAQFLTSTVAASAIGANKSKYVWDQTLIFQTADSGVGITRNTSGSIVGTAAATTQMAFVQYLPATTCREMLNNKLSVMLSTFSSPAGGVAGTVTLWYTTDGTLPSESASNNSIVLTLDANGRPATTNGTWVEIPRGALGDATFISPVAIDNNYANIGFSGWDAAGVGSTTATYFAIVVGTASMTMADTITFQAISVVPGTVPTLPAPQSIDSVLRNCQYYYEKSFEVGTLPVQNAAVNTGEFISAQNKAASTANNIVGSILYKVAKATVPVTITTYNPGAANAEVRNESTSTDCSVITLINSSLNGFALTCSTALATVVGNRLGIHWTADSRLGVF